MGQPIKILIADDHALLRRGLATLLEFNKGIPVVGDAKNGEEAVKASIAHQTIFMSSGKEKTNE